MIGLGGAVPTGQPAVASSAAMIVAVSMARGIVLHTKDVIGGSLIRSTIRRATNAAWECRSQCPRRRVR